MAVHNGQKYLVESVESILSQTYGNLEFLIVDDASSDDTPAILSALVARDGRIRVIRNDSNLGPYPSANRALETARAPIIARMDADDVSEPERLARQLRFLESNPRCLLVGCGYRSIDADGRVRFTKLNPMTPAVAGWVVRLTMPMVHPGFCFRRQLPGGELVRYDEGYPLAADYGLAAMLGSLGDIASLGDPLVRYRMHAANISTTRFDLQKKTARRISGEAVRRHYPPEVATAMGPLLDVINRRVPVGGAQLRDAVAGMNAALEHDGGKSPPGWMKQRAAGILYEACLGGMPRVRAAGLAIRLVSRGPQYLLPLAIRAAQVRNLLRQRPDPEG